MKTIKRIAKRTAGVAMIAAGVLAGLVAAEAFAQAAGVIGLFAVSIAAGLIDLGCGVAAE